MDGDENELEKSIQDYSNQLAFVTNALGADPNNEDLIALKSNLDEVLNLTKENLLSVKKKNLLASLSTLVQSSDHDQAPSSSVQNDDFEKELKRFQSELVDENEPEGNDQEISKFLAELEGRKCQAPYSEEWGQLAYHNAIVFSVLEKDIESVDEIEVKVLFCNPVCQSMKPCTFFLDGHCRFSPEQCRFSHGYHVKLSDLQDFKDPDYGSLQRDSLCLAKYKDDLWYKAIVENVLDDHKYSVKYVTYQETVVRALEDLVPLDHEYEVSSEDSSDSGDEEPEAEEGEDDLGIRILASQKLVNGPLGDWEKYTKGIGSKLMVQMGYIMGQGLGRNGEGITEPIEATILPQGKSLDRCMEIREMKEAGCDPFKAATKKRRLKESKENKVAAGYYNEQHLPKKENIFDFINSKLKRDRCKNDADKKIETGQTVKKSTVKNLNLNMLKVSEDLKKAQKEMGQLKQSLKRNKERRDRKMQSRIENKISDQEILIQGLLNKEKMIRLEQNSRSDQKKLTVF